MCAVFVGIYCFICLVNINRCTVMSLGWFHMIQYKWNQDKFSKFQVYQLKQQNFMNQKFREKYQDWADLYFLYKHLFIDENLYKYLGIPIVTPIKQKKKISSLRNKTWIYFVSWTLAGTCDSSSWIQNKCLVLWSICVDYEYMKFMLFLISSS